MCRTIFVAFPSSSIDRLVLESRLRAARGHRVFPWLWCIQTELWNAHQLRWHLIGGLRAGEDVAVFEAVEWAVGARAENQPNPYAAQL